MVIGVIVGVEVHRIVDSSVVNVVLELLSDCKESFGSPSPAGVKMEIFFTGDVDVHSADSDGGEDATDKCV